MLALPYELIICTWSEVAERAVQSKIGSMRNVRF
jgi:hypothetical protein